MITGSRKPGEFAGLALLGAIGGGLLASAPIRAEPACTCRDGQSVEAGVVSYSRNSDRESVLRVEADGSRPQRPCRAIWIGRTEIRPTGTPYQFHLLRMTLQEKRFDGCNYAVDRYVRRDKTYQFVFDSNSSSIREMRPIDSPDSGQLRGPAPGNGRKDAQSQSNTNLWDSITSTGPGEPPKKPGSPSSIDPTRELNRTSWVLAGRDIKAHHVGIVKDKGQNEKLIPLKKIRKIKAGQLGQVEAVNAGRAIVRFYKGSRIEKFSGKKNAIRRWYDKIGGPFIEVKDDLYTALRADIVEVAVDDIVEVNDYLDQRKVDRT
jgi:hypothetical protein